MSCFYIYWMTYTYLFHQSRLCLIMFFFASNCSKPTLVLLTRALPYYHHFQVCNEWHDWLSRDASQGRRTWHFQFIIERSVNVSALPLSPAPQNICCVLCVAWSGQESSSKLNLFQFFWKAFVGGGLHNCTKVFTREKKITANLDAILSSYRA